MSTGNNERPFKVIVVGAGVAGLAISHAFQKTDIDHVVLEKGVVAPPWGASITFWAHGLRLLEQLDCLDMLNANALPMQMMYCRDKTGQSFSTGNYFEMVTEKFGYDTLTFERRNFLQLIYDALPDKSFIKTGQCVVDVKEDDFGVHVHMADGSVIDGDIVIGCDGVHSTVREVMWKRANAEKPHCIGALEKQSLVTTYSGLIGICPTLPGLGIRDMTWVHNKHFSWLILTQPDLTYFFVHFKLAKQIRWPTKAKWSDEEAEKAAASVADHPVSESLVFGELWRNRIRGHLIGLQEGMFDHWYYGRTVLVGDSVHKVTPNFALGANCALESTAILLNKIHKMRDNLSPRQHPSKSTIEAMFEEYQTERKPRMRQAYEASYFLTRLQSYDGLWRHFLMRCVVPFTGQGLFANELAKVVRGAPRFEFLPAPAPRNGSLGFDDEHQRESIVEVVSGKSPEKAEEGFIAQWLLQIMALLTLLYVVLAGGGFESKVKLDLQGYARTPRIGNYTH